MSKGVPWLQAEEEKLIELYNDGATNAIIAYELGKTLKAVEQKCHKLRGEDKLKQRPDQSILSLNQIALTDFLDEPERKKEREEIFYRTDTGKRRRITFFFDWHAIFTDWQVFNRAVKESPGDIAALGGDIFDLYSVSRFRKEAETSVSLEMKHVLNAIELLVKNYEFVVCCTANHEMRVLKAIQDAIPPDVVRALRLKKAANPFNIIEKIFKDRFLYTQGWWYRIGDIIVAHPDWFSGATTNTAVWSYGYFVDNAEPFEVIMNAHTHQMVAQMHRRKLLIQVPTLAHKMDYVLTGKKWRNAWHKGWAIAELDKQGRAIINECRPIFNSHG